MDKLDCSQYAEDQYFFLQELKKETPPMLKAWECLDRLFKKRVLSYHTLLVSDQSEREAAYYNTIYIFWKKLRKNQFQLQGKDSILKFLGPTFRNVLLHVIRDQRKHLNREELSDDAAKEEPFEKTDSDIDHILHLKKVEKLLDELSPRQKQLVVLLILEDKEQDEIIAELGISYGTYRNLKSEAFAKLRALGPKWIKEGRL